MEKLIGRRGWNGLRLLGAAALIAACSQIAPESPEAPAGAPMVQTSTATVAPSAAAAPAPVALQKASASTFQVTSFLKPDRRLEHGDYIWAEEGVAAAGPIRIVVDLTAQVLYVYRGGVEIGRSAILYGADDKPTPLGTFPILEKDADHVSNIYDAPMPYMLRLTWDGVAIHGSEVEYGSATNGCVGVPDEFAALLFERAKIGDSVTITHGWKTGAESV